MNAETKKRRHLQPKLVLALILMGVVLMVALTFTIAKIYRSHMEAQYSETAFDMATVAAGLIDGDMIEKYHADYLAATDGLTGDELEEATEQFAEQSGVFLLFLILRLVPGSGC